MKLATPPQAQLRAAILACIAALLCSACMRVDVGAGGAVAMSGDILGDCSPYLGETCRTFDPMTVATIEATPAAGYTFAGFYDADRSQHCPGETTCRIRMTWPHKISAVFVPASYTPKSVHLGRDGIVYLHDDVRDLVHRWDVAEQHYWTPIRLGADALQVAHSTDTGILFVSHADGSIRRVRLDRGGVREDPFATASYVRELLPIGSSLYVASNYYGDGLFLADGTAVPIGYYMGNPTELSWHALSRRLFWRASYYADVHLQWLALDPATGAIGESGVALSDPGERPLKDPLRWSPDGKRMFSGSGHLYDATSLRVLDALPEGAADVVWLGNGELALLRGGADASTVERVGGDLRRYEVAPFAGAPLRVFADATELVVVTEREGRPAFATHPIVDDVDGDGVANEQDGFPADAAASLDADHDGSPDAWNAGRGAADSSTGLSALDAFPNDAACQLPEHARADDAAVCDLANGVPAYQADPASILMDREGVVHLLSPEQRKIFRWSASTQRHLEPIEIARGATRIAYASELHRLYLAYPGGVITKIDLEGMGPVEQPFLDLDEDVDVLAAAGSILLIVHGSTVETYRATGALARATTIYPPPSGNGTWSAAAGRLFFVEGTVHSIVINASNGAIGGDARSGYEGPLTTAPVRVSIDGKQLLGGTGELYDATSLAYKNSLPVELVDATWLTEGRIATLRAAAGGRTRLERWTATRSVDEFVRLPGTPLRIFDRNGALIVVTEVDGRPFFHRYVPSNDGDHDGAPNTIDAFPDDPAASVDVDRDGVPEAWNAGKGPVDSTQGLTQLDAFPLDSACHDAAQARDDDPALCDIARAIPEYAPDATLVDRSGTIHLLSTAQSRIYRWSIPAHAHLNPIPIGEGATRLAYAADSNMLYVGYTGGAITRIDLSGPARERPFATMAGAIRGLATAGEVIVAVDQYYRTYLPNGSPVGSYWSFNTSPQAWDPATNRLYYLADEIADRIEWALVDPSGGIGLGGATGYPYEPSIRPPIRVSADGARVAVGSGKIYEGPRLSVVLALPIDFADALWAVDGSLLTVREAVPGRSLVEEWSAGKPRLGLFRDFAGTPIALVEHDGDRIVVTRADGRPGFHRYVATEDGDGDGVANDEDGFPTDTAASLDSDRDGVPDAWNADSGPDESTTGLTDLDAFPLDSACARADHALAEDPTRCDIANRIPAYAPSAADVQVASDGTLYILDREHARIRRWSIPARAHLNPVPIGPGARAMTLDPATQHLFVAYDSGLITQIAPEAGLRETRFETLVDPARTMVMAGDFLFVATAGVSLVIDRSGATVARIEDVWFDAATQVVWSAATNRIYELTPQSFFALPIDPLTGALGERIRVYATYRTALPPLRLSQDGTRIILGSAEIYDATALTSIDHLRVQGVEATWLANGDIVTLRGEAATTRVEAWLVSGRPIGSTAVPGSPIRVVEGAGEVAVVTQVGDRPAFQIYDVSDDRDGDGAVNELDGFPDDAAASLDSDGDGVPDAWNPGKGPADSTSGLDTLDAFPDDSACQRPEQAMPGDPARCDVEGSLPAHFATSSQMGIDTHGVIYELNAEQRRVFRWSSDGAPLNPIPVRIGARRIAYQPALDRLYVAYDGGVIDRIDAADPSSRIEFSWSQDVPEVMVAAGELLYAARSSGERVVFRSNGERADIQQSYSYYGQFLDAAWNAASNLVYVLSSDSSYVLRDQSIDPATGALGDLSSNYVNYSGSHQAPLRLSRSGARALFGSGQIVQAATRARVTTLPHAVTDALWLADGTLVTVRPSDVDAETIFERWDASFVRTEAVNYPGQPLRVFQNGGAFVVVTQHDQTQQFFPNSVLGDADGDGVSNDDDVYPVDPAVALDRDGDGAPDAWNAGHGPEHSTTGLTALDAFPDDSACDDADEAVPGDPSRCDIAAALPPYVALRNTIEIDDTGTVYLLGASERRIFRWSLAERRDLNPIPTRRSLQRMAYVVDPPRLQLVDYYGDVSSIDLGDDLRERSLVDLPSQPEVFEGAGAFLFLRLWPSTLQTLAADGSTASSVVSPTYSYSAEWNPATDRVFTLDPYARLLRSHRVDPQSGAIRGEAMTTLASSGRSLTDFLRVSKDGARVLVGPGDVYDAATGALLATLPATVGEAIWLDDGTLVTLREVAYQQTRLERWSADFARIGSFDFAGEPLRLLAHAGHLVVVTQTDEGPDFTVLEAMDDIDGDGVTDDADAFPRDPAASLDSDWDGVPDAWNPGRGPADSTTGLAALDAFPNDTACQRSEQAEVSDPTRCDIEAAIPAYEPTLWQSVIDADGVVYLLSSENARIYRWSTAAGAHLDPIAIAPGAQFLALDAQLRRLYVAHSTGEIFFIDLTGALREQYFASPFTPVSGLIMIGDLVLANSWYGYGAQIFRPNGSLASSPPLYFDSQVAAWDPIARRLYASRMPYAGDPFGYWPIDPESGVVGEAVVGTAAVPVSSPEPPVRVSADGSHILAGPRKIFAADLAVVGELPGRAVDAAWLASGELVVLRDAPQGMTRLERRDADASLTQRATFAGTPLRVLALGDSIVVVTRRDGRPSFAVHAPGADPDGDGVLDPFDAFPTDPAASLDADADGAPETWNAGSGPEESTLGLLELDAFPDDAACQFASHTRDGVCDAHVALPTSLDEPFCNSDEIDDSLPATGDVVMSAAELLPLCSGWLLAAEQSQVVLRNGLDGRVALAFELDAGIANLQLDEERKLLYGISGAARRLIRLDLLTGASEAIDVESGVTDHVVTADGTVFAIAEWPGTIQRLPVGAVVFENDGTVSARSLAYNAVRDEVVALASRSFSPIAGGIPLTRYRIDPASGQLVEIEHVDLARGYRVPTGLVVSPDGTRIVVASNDFFSGSWLVEYDAANLQRAPKVWDPGRYTPFAYDPSGTRLAKVEGTSLAIYAADSLEELASRTLACAPYGYFSAPAFSRGGRLLFATERCAFDPIGTRLDWLRAD